MSMPVIPDLPVATVANDTDQLLIRQPTGALGIDKSVEVSLLRDFSLSSFPFLPDSPRVNDLMLLDNGGTNFQIRFDRVGFIDGTKKWFYQDVAPERWTSVGVGDTLLAVKGTSGYTIGGQVQGSWQQDEHIVNISELPVHSHNVDPGLKATGSTNRFARVAKDLNGDIGTDTDGGGGEGHDHSNIWRPLSSVGLICEKDAWTP